MNTGSSPEPVRLVVNGRHHAVPCDPGDTLLEVLRERLGLSGTKFGCGIGYCGACTVLVDGAAGHSCCLLAATLEGRHITTVEGIAAPAPNDATPNDATPNNATPNNATPNDATPDDATPNDATPGDVQAAFLEAGAVQCGYCTPGFVVSVKALLAENPSPDEADIRRFLAGNICRCSGFAAIVRAAVAAGQGEP